MPSIFEYAGAVRPVIIYLNDDSELVRVDATIREDYSHRYKATAHPLENGSTGSDHIIQKGDKLRLTGIISDDPLSIEEAAATTAAGAAGDLIGGIPGALAALAATKIAGKFLVGERRGQAAYLAIKTAQAARQLFVVSTGLAIMRNLVLEDFSVDRTHRNSAGLSFRATFLQVQVLADAPVGKIPAGVSQEPGAESEINAGTVPAEVANEQVTEKGASWLLGLGKSFAPDAISTLQGLAGQ